MNDALPFPNPPTIHVILSIMNKTHHRYDLTCWTGHAVTFSCLINTVRWHIFNNEGTLLLKQARNWHYCRYIVTNNANSTWIIVITEHNSNITVMYVRLYGMLLCLP